MPLDWLEFGSYVVSQQEHTQQDAIGGQGGHSAKRPDWACKPNHFLGQSQSEGLQLLFLPQKEILPFLLEQFSISQAQLWQLGAGARVRRRPVVNQGAL
jgi:hypothetical protein